MKRALLSLLAVGGLVLPGLIRAEDGPRVAVMDFVRADAPGSPDLAAADFSRAVQAKLLATADYVWTERQEMDRIMQEVDLGGLSRTDPASAVRLGHLLRADLMLRGEFGRIASGAGELNLEVLDLTRAEVLASRKVTVTMDKLQRLRPTAAEIDAAGNAALAALGEARKNLAATANLRVIAPLYFKNSGKSDRLNFLEDRLKAALTAAAVPAAGFRTLHFPRPAEASEEASLVLTGLTDADPEAWQHVADAYVWGTFVENDADGMAFDEVYVTITLQVWTGADAPHELTWDGPKKDLEKGIGTVVAAALEVVRQSPRAAPRVDAERKQVAESMRKRAFDLWQPITRKFNSWEDDATFMKTAYGQQVYAYRRRLLETACFFDPLNAGMQKERMEATWQIYNPLLNFESPRTWWLWLQDCDTQAQRFRGLADDSISGFWPQTMMNTAVGLEMLFRKADLYPEKTSLTFEDIYRQRRAVRAMLSRMVVETNRAAAAAPVKPSWLKMQNQDWLEQLFRLDRNFRSFDAIIARETYERDWPALKVTIGQTLRAEVHDGDKQALIDHLFSAYVAFGEIARARSMLNAAWDAADTSEPPPSASLRSAGPRIARQPRVDQPWANSSSAPPAAGPAVPVPELPAFVREIEPWREIYPIGYQDQPRLFGRLPTRKIDALTWDGSRLWFAETNEPLPASLGPANSQGNFYLWRYDPALHEAELITPKIGSHAAVAALLPSDKSVWVGLDSEGVEQVDRQDLSLHRHNGENGLMATHIIKGVRSADSLFFLGGSEDNYSVNRYVLADGKWTGVQVPRLWRPQDDYSRKPPMIAASGDWLGASNSSPLFYNLKSNRWSPLLQPSEEPQRYGQPDPPTRLIVTSLSADGAGFWLGSSGRMLFLNPNSPTERREIVLPGTPIAAAHDGAWLWLLLAGDLTPAHAGPVGEMRYAVADSTTPARLLLVDKRSGTCVGQLTLPPGDMTGLVAAGGHVWVAGPGLFEVNRAVSGPAAGPPAPPSEDHALWRAAWAGDLEKVEALLVAKPDVNAATPQGWTPLLAATSAGQTAVAQRLLAAGANPNQVTAEGIFALQLAAEGGDAETTRALLAASANVNLAPGIGVRAPPMQDRNVEPPSPNLDATTPTRPVTGLKGTLNEWGDVVLTWEDHADNESRYKIAVRQADGSLPVIADLPANSTSWVHAPDPREADVQTFVVAPVNGSLEFPTGGELPSVTVKLVRTPPNGKQLLRRENFEFWTKPMPVAVLSRPALSTAALHGRVNVARVLLEHKADPDIRSDLNSTPLLLALHHQHYAMARLLLSHGAHAELDDDGYQSAAFLVYWYHEDEPLLRQILASLPPERRWIETSSLIHLAAERGQIRDIEQLVALGGDVAATTSYLNNAVSYAARNRQVATVDWLLHHGFSLKTRTPPSPAWDVKTVEQHIARTFALEADDELLALLLENGFDPNVEVSGKPLISVAAASNDVEGVRLLKAHGADLSRKSQQGKTPADYASGPTLALLQEKNTRPKWTGDTMNPMSAGVSPPGGTSNFNDHEQANQQMLAACRLADRDATAAALAAGADLNVVMPENQPSPLQLAVSSGKLEFVRFILESGAWVNGTYARHETALAVAVAAKRADLVEFLLSAGADPNTHSGTLFDGRDGAFGNTPLFRALAQDDLKMVEYLLNAGADPNLLGQYHNYVTTPLGLALARGQPGMADVLLRHGADPLPEKSIYRLQPGT